MMFLIDTNIFLEILLGQDKKKECIKFLDDNSGNICISDFTLHSIGVILFRYGKEDLFLKFTKDILNNIKMISLPAKLYSDVVKAKKTLKLDFDDAYQYCISKFQKLTVATMDRDFDVIKDSNIIFL